MASFAPCLLAWTLATACVSSELRGVERGSVKELQTQVPCSSAQTQLELNTCWARLAEKAEKDVATRSDEAAQLLKKENRQESLALFQQAQRQWELYRDNHCNAARSLYEGGSIAPMMHATCRVRLAQERMTEMDSVYGEWAGLRKDGREK